MKECGNEQCLWLAEGEAMGLLDIVLLTPNDLSADQRAALIKLSEFCRQFLRDSDEDPLPAPSTTLSHIPPAPVSRTTPYSALSPAKSVS